MSDKDDLAERVSFRVSSKIRARLEQIADQHDWRVSQAARHALRRGIESDNQDEPGAAA